MTKLVAVLPWTPIVMLGRLLAAATIEPPNAGPVRRTIVRWLGTVAWLLQFEPSWFAEFGLAVGALMWGLGALLTDDMTVRGGAVVLPVAAMIGGVGRCLILLRLWYEARVLFAAAGAALWSFLWIGLMARYGILPLPGLLVGAFLIELLTAAKFSIPCALELRDEYLARVAH